ncbi:hypothetical protein AB0O07_11970 [Streptomyces sp. NPDC093085]|uniref:hypothetical protein n=1 Tax=Streptomyces sp. NPDC093085 TaxID=3155068 RepID=UPI00342CEB27
MGWTVLYIAFGIVALWLLGEVLLQYKARLRWRVLAFTGFMGVVLGVLIPNVFVIVLGTIAFAVGQTYVTLSFRSGFSTGWSLAGRPGASKRRKGGGEAVDREPALEVSDLAYEPVPEPSAGAEGVGLDAAPGMSSEAHAEAPSVYAPMPMPDETGQYGIYDDAVQDARTASYANAHANASADRNDLADPAAYGGGYETYSGYGTHTPGQDAYATAAQDGYGTQDAYAHQGGWDTQDAYAQQTPQQYQTHQGDHQYGYGSGDQGYAGYAEPTYLTGGSSGGRQYDASYDSFGGQQQYAAPYNGGQDQQSYANDTPPGGVWVPQQRERQDDPFAQNPTDRPHQGYDAGSGSGYPGDQYRY